MNYGNEERVYKVEQAAGRQGIESTFNSELCVADAGR